MGLFDRVEKGLEKAVNGVFAKAFPAEVQPVEIASAIRRVMDDRAAVLGHGRTMVPNIYTIILSPTDFERLDEYSAALSDELVAAAQEHADSQRYIPGGPIEVLFAEGPDLETGVIHVRPSTTKRTMAPTGMPPSPSQGPAPGQPVPPGAAPGTAGAAAYGGQGADAASPSAFGASAGAGQAHAAVPSAGAGTVGAGTGPPSSEPTTAYHPQPARRRPTVSAVARPWLEFDGERYPLLGPLTVIGRDASADIVLDDQGISRRHSEIRVTNDGPHLVASIRDLASTNGTFVNGERITSTRLRDGDRVTVGRTSVVYRAGKR
ncbi:MAG: DUF3662 and FHA domain-containing protein [Dermatophilaceae bacterium]